MKDRIQEAFVDELEKMGYLGLASKAVKAVAGKGLKGAATGMSRVKPPKQGLLGGLAKNQTLRSAGSSLAQGAMWMAPSALMSRGQRPRERPQPVTGGLS